MVERTGSGEPERQLRPLPLALPARLEEPAHPVGQELPTRNTYSKPLLPLALYHQVPDLAIRIEALQEHEPRVLFF